MSLIEAMTMVAGLVYLVLLAWQARSGWQWRLALGLLALVWLLVADSLLWLGLGLVVVPLALWHRYRPQPALGELGSQPLRSWARHLLLLCWGLVTVQYGLHIWQLGQGESPWLVRPDVVDGFLPIAGGLGLRAWLGQGLVDPHHPAATITVLVLSLSALLLGRAFCAWFCPLGVVGEWLHGLRNRLLPGEWTPPRWLDWPCGGRCGPSAAGRWCAQGNRRITIQGKPGFLSIPVPLLKPALSQTLLLFVR